MTHLDGTDDGVGYGVRGTGNNQLNPPGSGVRGTNPQGSYGVYGDDADLVGVYGEASNAVGICVYGLSSGSARGVQGQSVGGEGVMGASTNKAGVRGESNNSDGVQGETNSSYQPGAAAPAGVWGNNLGSGPGVKGTSTSGDAIIGVSTSNAHAGVSAVNDSGGFGIWARGSPAGHFEGNVEINGSLNATSVRFKQFDGVHGESSAPEQAGVFGINNFPASNAWGLRGVAQQGIGVYATGGKYAGVFEGDVAITGSLSKTGGGFKIDHPEDPANKYLNHSFVESAEMKNVYDGTVTLDAHGKATVTMPAWVEALNRSFCYQLTSIGTPSPELHIASELRKGKFQIAGGKPGSKVSWQVTGVRNDAWAKANQIPVEEEKRHGERGHYLYPSLFGQS